MKRSCHVMVRLTESEHAEVLKAKPADMDVAVFVRTKALEAIAENRPADSQRRVAAFIVTALSNEYEFDEVLALFDEHVLAKTEGSP